MAVRKWVAAGLAAVLLAGCAAWPEDGTGYGDWTPEPTAREELDVADLEPAATAGAAVMAWWEASGWPTGLGVDYSGLEIRLPRHNRAEVFVTNLRDDAIRDYEYRLHLEERDAGWVITRIERRIICRRGLSPDGLCR